MLSEEEREQRAQIEAARRLRDIAQRVLDGEEGKEEAPAPEPEVAQVPQPEHTPSSLRDLIKLGGLRRWW